MNPLGFRGRLMLTLGILLTLGGATLLYVQFSSNSASVPSANFNSFSIGYPDGVSAGPIELDVITMSQTVHFSLYFHGYSSNPHFFLILPYEITTLNSGGANLTVENIPGSGSIIYGEIPFGSLIQGSASISGLESYSDSGTHSLVLPIGNTIPVRVSDRVRTIKELTNVPFRGFYNVQVNLYLPKEAQVLQTFPEAQNFQFFNGTLPRVVEQVITWQDIRNNVTGQLSQLSITYAIPSDTHLARLEEFGSGLLFGAGIPILVSEAPKVLRSGIPGDEGNRLSWRRNRWSWVIAIALVYIIVLFIAYTLNLLDSKAAFTAAIVGLVADLAAPIIHLKLFEEPSQSRKRVASVVSELNLFDNEWTRIRSRIRERNFRRGDDPDLARIKGIGDDTLKAQSALREDEIKEDDSNLVRVVREIQELGTNISEVHRGDLIQTEAVIRELIERGDNIQQGVRDLRTKLENFI